MFNKTLVLNIPYYKLLDVWLDYDFACAYIFALGLKMLTFSMPMLTMKGRELLCPEDRVAQSQSQKNRGHVAEIKFSIYLLVIYQSRSKIWDFPKKTEIVMIISFWTHKEPTLFQLTTKLIFSYIPWKACLSHLFLIIKHNRLRCKI